MNMQQVMAQARKMQERIEETQAELADKEVSASAGGGAVRVVATADGRLRAVNIAPDVCDPDDVEMLEDLVLAAVNEALSAAQQAADQAMSTVTGDIGIPGL